VAEIVGRGGTEGALALLHD
jgi:hypothetical protein